MRGMVKGYMLALFLISVLSVGIAEGLEVTRQVPSEVLPNEEFEVTLVVSGDLPIVVGINETIPDRFAFVSTTCEDYSVSGNVVAFALINDTEIRYRVRAPSSGQGTFKGNWVDMLNENEGSIADTTVTVRTAPASAPTPVPEIESVKRHAPSEVSPNEEFEVTLTIEGNLPIIAGINETIPDGFTFVSTTFEHYNISGQKLAFAAINVTEIKYRVRAPSSGHGTFKGNWVDMLNENEGSIADTTVTVKTTTTSSSSGTGGESAGGGSSFASALKASSEYHEALLEYLYANQEKIISPTSKLEEKTGITEIGALVDENVGMVSIVISKVSSLPEDVKEPEGNLYNCFEIVFTRYGTQTEIEPSGYIKYKISKEWLKSNNAEPSDVKFLKWDNDWIQLLSEVLGEDNSYHYFKINLDSFCIFAVVAEATNTATTTPAVESSSTAEVTPEETPEETIPVPEEKSTTTPSEKVTSELEHIGTSVQNTQLSQTTTVTIAIAAVVLCFTGITAYFVFKFKRR